MSSVSQPKRSRIARASSLAELSLPQMNIDGRPEAYLGSTIIALPTELKHLTKRALGAFFCSRSSSESPGPVKKASTPLTGGRSAMGFVVSSTVLPSRPAPHAATASSAAEPLTARTTRSPLRAASATVAVEALADAFCAHPASFSGSRVPRATA